MGLEIEGVGMVISGARLGVTCFGIGKFLTCEPLIHLHQNLDMMLLGYILRCDMNLIQIHHHLAMFHDFTNLIKELGFSPCISILFGIPT